jgi:hypothetical protein
VSLSSKWDDYKQYGVASFALNKVGLKLNTQGDKVRVARCVLSCVLCLVPLCLQCFMAFGLPVAGPCTFVPLAPNVSQLFDNATVKLHVTGMELKLGLNRDPGSVARNLGPIAVGGSCSNPWCCVVGSCVL